MVVCAYVHGGVEELQDDKLVRVQEVEGRCEEGEGLAGGDGDGRRGAGGGVRVLQDDTAVTLPGLLSVSLTWEHTRRDHT